MKHKISKSGPPPKTATKTPPAPPAPPKQAPPAAGQAGRPRRTNEMPRYDSMEQMANVTGIPIEIVKEAKRSGAGFVIHDRCDLGAFLKWYFAVNLNAEERENWTRRDKRASALGKEHDLDRKRRLVIDRDVVLRGIDSVVGVFSAELDRLEQELPPTLEGLNKSQIRSEVAKQKKAVRRLMDENLEAFKKDCTE